jgi:hypothetical protein
MKSSSVATKKRKQNKGKKLGIFIKSIHNKSIVVHIKNIGSNIKEILKKKLESLLADKCSEFGFIRKNSIDIITFNSGIIEGAHVRFNIIFECLVCNVVENMKIRVNVKNITKAGFKAFYGDSEETSPILVFISRDHSNISESFKNVKEGDSIIVKIIGSRYELNDNKVYVIAELSENQKDK